MGLLDPDKASKLSNFEAAAGKRTWQEHVRESLEVDAEFVSEVYALCRGQGKDEAQALGFILRGLGCPVADEQMRAVLE